MPGTNVLGYCNKLAHIHNKQSAQQQTHPQDAANIAHVIYVEPVFYVLFIERLFYLLKTPNGLYVRNAQIKNRGYYECMAQTTIQTETTRGFLNVQGQL